MAGAQFRKFESHLHPNKHCLIPGRALFLWWVFRLPSVSHPYNAPTGQAANIELSQVKAVTSKEKNKVGCGIEPTCKCRCTGRLRPRERVRPDFRGSDPPEKHGGAGRIPGTAQGKKTTQPFKCRWQEVRMRGGRRVTYECEYLHDLQRPWLVCYSRVDATVRCDDMDRSLSLKRSSFEVLKQKYPYRPVRCKTTMRGAKKSPKTYV